MSGELPRPIKGTSLHHPHGSYTISTNNPNTPNAYHYSPYNYISSAPAPLPHQFSHASSSSLARPASGSARRGEFAVPALPHRNIGAVASAAQTGSFSHSSGSGIPPMPGLVHSATPGAPVGAKRGRRPNIGERHDAIWSQEVQDAFLTAARSIPNNGKNWIMRDGRQYGRNALIAEEIFRLTGQQRTRQQISSHIQVLKKVHADEPNMMRILNGQLEEDSPNGGSDATLAGAPTSAPLSRVGSGASSPSVVKTEDHGSSISPPPTFASDPIEELMNGQSFMSVIRSNPPTSNPSEGSLPGTPQSPQSGTHTSERQPLQLAELLPRSATPPPVGSALGEPLVADITEKIERHPGAWRGERLAYITAITIWAERTLHDAGVRSRPTTTHVYAQMHSATCPLEPLPADMEEIVRQIGPGTCMHAEIGIALPPAGMNVGKIKATLVIEAMKEFDGYCLTDAFCGDEGRFMSTHTTVFPTGREAREKYSWTYEIPYATEVWKKVLTKNPHGAHGMRLVQKYVRSLAGGNRNGDVNVALMVVHDIHVVPPGEVGYSRIKHVDLTGEQAKHDAMGVSVTVKDDSEESSCSDGDVKMEEHSPELLNRRAKPNLSVAIPPAEEERLQIRTRHSQLANASQPVTPFEQLVHTPQHPPPLANHGHEMRRGWLWAPTPTEGSVPGGVGMKPALGNEVHGMMGGVGDGGNRMAWLTRDALAAGTPTLAEFAGRDHEMEGERLAAPVRIDRGGMQGNEYFPMSQ